VARALARLAQKEVELNEARAKLLSRERDLRYQPHSGRLAPSTSVPEPGPGDAATRPARPPYAEDWCLEPEPLQNRRTPDHAASNAESSSTPVSAAGKSVRSEEREAPSDKSLAAAGALPARRAAERAAEGRAVDAFQDPPKSAAQGASLGAPSRARPDPADPPAGEVKYSRKAGVSALIAPSSAGATAPSVRAESLINSTVAAARDAMGRRKEQDHSAELNAKADERAAGAEPARRIAERAQSGRAADAFRGVSGWAAEPQASAAAPPKPAHEPPPAPVTAVPRGFNGEREYFRAHSGFGVRSDQMRRKR